MATKQRILILGGGFAGVYAALRLEKTLARDPGVEVTLVGRDNYLLFTPMLHEVATGEVDPTHIVNPIRKLLKRVHFFAGEVEGVDLRAKTVTVAHGGEHHHHTLAYDQLVLALGAVTNFFNLPGLAENALTMKTLNDALYLRNRVIQNLEQADAEDDPEARAALLTLVVAGGGFAGVETVGGLNDFIRESIRFYPRLRGEDVRVVLVEAGPALLPELGEKLGRYAQTKLGKRKVEVLVNTAVQSFDGDSVELGNGTSIRTNTLVWTAGVSPHPLLANLPCTRERGRVVVNEFLEVPEWPGVWALGDCAYIRDPRTGKPYPPTAQHAVRQGKVLGDNLTAALRGGRKRPFVFTTLGLLAAIGRRTGVARILGVNFSGFLAWWLWRSIYLSKLPRLEKKIRVALDWTLDLFFTKDLVQYSTSRAPSASHPGEHVTQGPSRARGSDDSPTRPAGTARLTRPRGMA